MELVETKPIKNNLSYLFIVQLCCVGVRMAIILALKYLTEDCCNLFENTVTEILRGNPCSSTSIRKGNLPKNLFRSGTFDSLLVWYTCKVNVLNRLKINGSCISYVICMAI